MERFVWDGDQLLQERRDYGWWGEDPATLNGNGSSTGNFYGTTTYAYALGLFGPDTPLLLFPASGGTVIPEANWRGTYEAGTGTDGSNVTTYNWPGQQTGLYLAPDLRRTSLIVETKWYGNIVEGKADPSGLVYDRNRYYDPTAGRFTQEDPIGLAGGLNLYGYAAGDPANNSDPFGLCVWDLCIGEAVAVNLAYAALATTVAAAYIDITHKYGQPSTWFNSSSSGADATAFQPGGRFSGATKERIDRDATSATGQSGTCEFCGTALTPVAGSPNSTEYDHQVPKSKGGDNSPENGRRACRTCNRTNGAKDKPDPRNPQPPEPPRQ